MKGSSWAVATRTGKNTVIKIDTRPLSHAKAKRLVVQMAKKFRKRLKFDAKTGQVLPA